MRAPDFWRRTGVPATCLRPVEALVVAWGRRRRARVRPLRLAVPVLCAGNVVVGGGGKTPTAILLAQRLAAAGLRPHFLSRGYGGRLRGPVRVDPARHGAADVGDEPLLLAEAGPCWVSRDRAEGGRIAVAAGAGAIVMDDGFQNPSLARDLSLLVFDGGYGVGNGRVLPAGPLREPLDDALGRAQAALVVGPDETGVAERIGLRLPVLRGRYVPTGAADLAGRRVIGFAGIARPAKFFATLAATGAEVVETRAFPDHHPYPAETLDALVLLAAERAAALVTTAKDWVRLPAAARATVRRLDIRLELDDPGNLDALLPAGPLP